jgi:hypothetical protein
VTDRYADRPFLRLLDAFVMWSIGALDERTARSLDDLTPDVITSGEPPTRS